MSIEQSWVPPSCTLPTTQQPLRTAEFDRLFTTALHEQHRLAPTRLRWHLDPAAEDTVRDLTARESSCCSFFTFAIEPAGAVLTVDVHVTDTHVGVLDALAARAAAGLTA